MSITLDEYLNSLDASAVGCFKLNEAEEDTRKFTSLFAKISSLKLRNKKEAKAEANKISKSKRTKNIEKVLKQSTKPDGTVDAARVKKGLIEEAGGAISNVLGQPGNIFALCISVYKYIGQRSQGRFGLTQFATIFTILIEIPELLLIKLSTKTKKKYEDIRNELEEDTAYESIRGYLSVLQLINFVASTLVMLMFGGMAGISILTISGLVMMLLSVAKMVYGVYIGNKRNNWKYYDKLIKQKVGESTLYTYAHYLDSAVYISSLRENLFESATSENSKNFLLYHATDYEILYLTIEGEFPEISDGDCQILIDILNIEFDADIISIEDANLSTVGINSSVLIETILADNWFAANILSESNLLEAHVDPNKLAKLEKIMKAARAKLVKSHPDRGGNEEEAKKAGAEFQDAKNRYNTYKETGKDPGEKSYTYTGPSTGETPDATWWTSFVQKVWTFSPKYAALKILRKVYGAEKLSRVLKTSPALAGGVILLAGPAVAAMFTWASYKAYYRFLSKAAKACKGKKSSIDKSICMSKYEIQALETRKKDLSKVKSFCSKLKEKQQKDCNLALQAKIDSLNDEVKDGKDLIKKLEQKVA